MTTLTARSERTPVTAEVRGDLIRVALVLMIFLNLSLGVVLAARDSQPIAPQPVEWFGNVAVSTR